MVKAVILAGGRGERLKPLTDSMPKPMLLVGGKPILWYCIQLLKKHGVKEIALAVHYLPEKIRDYFKDGSEFGVRLTYSIEEKPLGTAGAVKKLANFIGGESFFVLYGDTLTAVDLGKMRVLLEKKKTAGVAGIAGILAVQRKPTKKGGVAVGGDFRITSFEEDARREFAFSNAGVYLFSPRILDFIPENQFFDFGKNVFPAVLSAGLPLYACELSEYKLDVGTLAKYAQAQSDVKKLGKWFE